MKGLLELAVFQGGKTIQSYGVLGICIYTNRYYTRVELAYVLAKRRTWLTGTVKASNKHMPKEFLLDTDKRIKNGKKGKLIFIIQNKISVLDCKYVVLKCGIIKLPFVCVLMCLFVVVSHFMMPIKQCYSAVKK